MKREGGKNKNWQRKYIPENYQEKQKCVSLTLWQKTEHSSSESEQSMA